MGRIPDGLVDLSVLGTDTQSIMGMKPREVSKNCRCSIVIEEL